MKTLAKVASCLLLAAATLHASTTVLSGNIKDAQGAGLNGTLVMRLPIPAQDTTTNTAVAPTPVYFKVINGAISGTAPLYDTATLQPQNLYYIARAYDQSGALAFYGNYVVTGASFSLSAATPTSVTTSNVSYLSPVSLTGTNLFTGSNQWNGVSTVCNSSGEYLRGECYGSLAAAMGSTDCAATGCTIDMSSPGAGRALATVDPGTKVIKIILGSFQTYTIDHVVCNTGLEFGGRGIIGNGAGTLVASVGLNSQPVITVAQSNTYSASCHIHDIKFQGLAGNTSQQGLFFDVSTLSGVSIQNSVFENLSFLSFKGADMELKGRPNDATSAIQFNTFRSIFTQKFAGRVSPSLKATGYSGQNRWENVLLTTPNGDGLDVIYLGPSSAAGTYVPTASQLLNITPQGGSVGVHLGGVTAITLDGGFSEATPTVFSITQDSPALAAASNNGVIIKNWYVAGTSAATAVLTNTDNVSFVNLSENTIYGTPGAFITGASAARVDYCHNYGPNASTAGCYVFARFSPMSTTVGALPAAAAGNGGQMVNVTDSTAIAAEGQTCAGGGTVSALARSNGVAWKCF